MYPVSLAAGSAIRKALFAGSFFLTTDDRAVSKANILEASKKALVFNMPLSKSKKSKKSF